MERYQDVQLLRLLGRQLDEEVRQYAADLRAGLIEDSGKRKSKETRSGGYGSKGDGRFFVPLK